MDINDIKTIASKISGDYLKDGSNMNDAVLAISVEKKINKEMIKALCAIINQNTYLSIFHADKEKRGNILFDLAKAEEVIKKIKELDMTNEDYLTAPIDFRLTDQYEEPIEQQDDEEPISNEDKIVQFGKKLDLINRLSHLSSAINTMEFQENQNAERNILKVSSYCKGLVANGESFGDMAKLALRYTKDNGLNMEKTAKLYSTIGQYLSNKGFKVPMELTKISSLEINKDFEAFKPLEEYHLNLLKVAGFKEMKDNIEKVSKYMKAKKNSMKCAVK